MKTGSLSKPPEAAGMRKNLNDRHKTRWSVTMSGDFVVKAGFTKSEWWCMCCIGRVRPLKRNPPGKAVRYVRSSWVRALLRSGWGLLSCPLKLSILRVMFPQLLLYDLKIFCFHYPPGTAKSACSLSLGPEHAFFSAASIPAAEYLSKVDSRRALCNCWVAFRHQRYYIMWRRFICLGWCRIFVMVQYILY